MNNSFTNKTLQVPYYSQYRDICDTLNAHRSCGMSAIKMALDYYEKASAPLEELVSKYIIDETAYGPSGWKHDFFVSFLKSYGLNAYRKEKMNDTSDLEEIKESIIKGSPVLASVEQKIFDKKLFHIVLLVGVRLDENNNLLGFFYHDPGRLKEETGANQYVDLKIFLEYWRKMAIFTNSKF